MAGRPDITSVEFSPNPANAKAGIRVSVAASDRAITFSRENIYAGEICSGQQTGVI